MASRVRRLTVKPKACIRKTPPTSDTGIATIGIRTERNDPRKRKMTIMTIKQRVTEGLQHLVDGGGYVVGGVVGDARLAARRGRSLWMPAISARTLLITSRELALGRGQMPMNTAVWPEKWTSVS